MFISFRAASRFPSSTQEGIMPAKTATRGGGRALRRAMTLIVLLVLCGLGTRVVVKSARNAATRGAVGGGGGGGGGGPQRGLPAREHKHGASFGGRDPGDHGVTGGSIGAGHNPHDDEEDAKDTSGVATTPGRNFDGSGGHHDHHQHQAGADREEEDAHSSLAHHEGAPGPDASSPSPPSPPSPPPPLSPPPSSPEHGDDGDGDGDNGDDNKSVDDRHENNIKKAATRTPIVVVAATPKTKRNPGAKLVAGNSALEVDHNTHATNEEAAKAIAQAGRDVKGHADRLDRDKIVFASFVSKGFHEFMLNWYAHTQRLGIDNVIVAAFDDETEALCREKGIPYHSDADLRYTFDVVATGGQPLHDPNAKVTMEGRAFQQIGALKAAFLLHLLQKGYRVLVSDVDTVWLRDPRDWFDTDDLPQRTDVSLSTDCLSHAEEKNSHGCWHMQFNTGILWLRPTTPTKELMAQWRDALLTTKDKFEHDQDIFNRLLRHDVDGTSPGFKLVTGEERGKRGTKSNVAEAVGEGEVGEQLQMAMAARGITLGALPLSRFCSGHVFFVQRLPIALGVKPLVVHTTYQFSQARGKRQRLRETGLWIVDEDGYYSGDTGGTGPGDGGGSKGFVAMSPEDQPPKELLTKGIANHLAAAAWYRLAIRNLIAVGRATNRVPIMPRIVCLCDRYWGNVLPGCAIPGSDKQPPFERCPQDHIMNLPNMERAEIDWREWSFLDSPRLPESMKRAENRVYVELELPAGFAPGGGGGGAVVAGVRASDEGSGGGGGGGEGGRSEEGGGDGDDGETRKTGAVSLSSSSSAVAAAAAVVSRVVRMPAFPTDAEWKASLGTAKERVAIVSSGVASFCTFKEKAKAKKFDELMATALQAESHFCGHGGTGGHFRSCEIGFDVPKGTSVDDDCAAMRKAAAEAGGGTMGETFRARYAQIGKHLDS